jgi:stage V sporulation protein B
MFGALSIPFFCISTLTNGLLQGINKMGEPVKNALVSLVLYVIFLMFTLVVLHLNIYGVLISLVFYGFMMCILNRMALNRYSKVKQDIFKTYVLPLIASLIMGVFVYLSYQLFLIITHSNALGTIVSIFVGIFTYFVAIVKVHGISENEMRRFPKGELLVRFAYKLHLL